MATVIAYDDVKANQHIRKSKSSETINVNTPFLGSRGVPNLPLVALAKFAPGRCSTAHFHDVAQFQIMIEGKGKMGRHDISTNSVHFSRAYTPYGPFTADAETGLTCLIIRPSPDTGAQHDPGAIAELRRMPNRRPWQITRDAHFSEMGSANVTMQPVPELQDNNGLATYTLRMKPGTKALTPDPAIGEGLFVVVLKGSLLHEDREAKALTLVHISNQESKFEICAGSQGLEGLIVQFPRNPLQSADALKNAQRGTKSWHCSLCSFVYDEAVGRPEEGIAAGTRWEDVPATWTCPDCAADKSGFEQTDL